MSESKERNAEDSEEGSDAGDAGTQGGTTRKPKTTIGEYLHFFWQTIFIADNLMYSM
jgi:hypothetical protein